jgi:hypothetical protein
MHSRLAETLKGAAVRRTAAFKPHRSSNSACSTKQSSANHCDLLQHFGRTRTQTAKSLLTHYGRQILNSAIYRWCVRGKIKTRTTAGAHSGKGESYVADVLLLSLTLCSGAAMVVTTVSIRLALKRIAEITCGTASKVIQPTLRRHPQGCLRTAWGRCGPLYLHRRGLAPLTPCRSHGAPVHKLKTSSALEHRWSVPRIEPAPPA